MLNIDLSGKTALVTGASGELGRAIARTLADCGANLILHYYQNEEGARKLLTEIGDLQQQAIIVQADITKQADVESLRAIAEERLAAPDIVVINAVIQYEWTTVLDQPLEDFEGQFRSCALQTVLLAKAFAPAMIKNGWGRFIAVNTECAMRADPNQSAYAAGKRAMDGIVRVLAKEIGQHRITVNQVAPGWMISDKDRSRYFRRGASYEKTVPLRRRGEDIDVAHAVAFFASDLAGFITGAYLPVAGGNVMPAI